MKMAALKITKNTSNTSILKFDLDVERIGRATGKLIHFYGFDPEGRFLMIGQGARTQFSVAGGSFTGLTFKFRPGSGGSFKFIGQDMTIKFGSSQGLVTIEAVSPGECALELVDSQDKTIDRIDVKVVPFTFVATRFYNLIDGKGRRGLDPDSDIVTQQALATLVDRVNMIVMLQCGVGLKLNGEGRLRDLKVVGDMEDPVIIEKQHSALFESTDIDRAAEYHVILVWNLPPQTAGITLFEMSLIKSAVLSRPFPPESTVAHEFVHFLSPTTTGKSDHDPEKSDLMRDAPAEERGIMMRRERQLKSRANH
jgi:hypothetical protein